jgi:hypothetical protein
VAKPAEEAAKEASKPKILAKTKVEEVRVADRPPLAWVRRSLSGTRCIP